MRFVLITRSDLEATNALFRDACTARSIPYVELTAGHAAGVALDGPGARLIYCAAVDHNSRLLEKLLVRPGDALLHDPHFVCDHQPIRLARAGLPVAKAVYVPDPERLEEQAAWLGGFPVVVKRPNTEGGQGVSQANDLATLRQQLETPDADGAMIEAYMAHDLCWRLTVLNGQVLAASASAAPAGDFRSNVHGGTVVEDAPLPEGASRIAITAVEALNLKFGGVDLMQGPDGQLTVAEVNFPCYFADQQARTGTDISGEILDYLAEQATHRVKSSA